MNQKILALAIVLCLAIAVFPIGKTEETHEKETIDAEIYLKAGIFDPLKEKIELNGFKTEKTNFYILQFNGVVEEEWKSKIKGAKFFGYIPDNAFIVKMHQKIKERIEKYDFVRTIIFYEPRYKIDNNLLDREGEITLIINIFENPKNTAREIAKYGIILEISGKVIKAIIDSKNIKDIALIEDVEWIEEFVPFTIYNDVAKDVLNVPTTWNTYGLNGTNQIVGICDTGIDTGVNDASMHDDIEGRIVAIFDRVGGGDGADDRNSGHGTHVTGSVLGNGSRSSGQIKGMAPNAKLVFQAVETDGGNFGVGIPADLNVLFQEAYDAGARIHTNSWGSWGQSIEGTYTSYSNDVDEFSWNNKNFTILFAAANQGRDRNADGIIDLESIGAPATAKNSISVGATENNRPNITLTYGGWWPSNYPANPIYSDKIADNINGLAAFSSRGPTNDNRIKPDIVSPGTWVLSTKSSQTSATGWGPPSSYGYSSSLNPYYTFMGGTSMATPLTAGTVALIRQYYTDLKGITPSSALIKATLINGATDMLGQYGNDANAIPNFHEGWGRVNLTNALFPTGRILDYKDVNSLTTGGEDDYYYSVSSSSQPLKITLVWTDYPATTTSLIALVNNLDLVLISPSGKEYKGNVFENSFSVEGGTADNRNNVENVYISQPEIGIWTVKIKGTNIPNGPQSYALVSTGAFSPELKVEDITFSGAMNGVNINAVVKNIGSSDVPSYFGNSFSSITSGSSEQFNDVAFNFIPNKEQHPNQLTSYGIIVGNNGKVMKYYPSNNTFVNLTTPTTNNLNAVEFARDNSYALIVGDNGTVLRYDGNNFFAETGYSGNLKDIKFYNDFSIIVGENKVYKRTISYSTIYFDDFETANVFTKGKDGYSYSSTTYNWIEISAIGTLAQGSGIDDKNTAWYSLPFKFNFYGYLYDKIRISTNGFITFSALTTSGSNTNLPSSTIYTDAILPHWDNLHTRTNGRIYYYSNSSYFVVQWNNVSAYTDTGDYLTFEVILYKNGTIKFQYKDITAENSNGSSATVGIQKDYLSAVVYSYNTASLSNNTAIEFKYSPMSGDEWQLGNSTSPTPYSGSKMWGTDLTGNYENYADYVLISPTLNLSNSVYNYLEFYQWREFEDTWDTGFIEVSKDNKTWERLENKNYIFGSIYPAFNFFPGYFSNSSWQKEVYDISSYKEDNINVRFHFRSDSATTYNGWFIDDFKITRGVASVQEFNYSGSLNSATIINSTYSLIVGNNGKVLKYDGSSLTLLRSGGEDFNSISLISLMDTNSDTIPEKFKVLIVGNNGIALTYDGSSFSSLTTSTTENLNSVSLSGDYTSALIVGNNGVILKYSLANETIYSLPSLTENLFGIFTSPFKDARAINYDTSYIVGKNGKFAKGSSTFSYTLIRVGFYNGVPSLANLLGYAYINNGISPNSQKIATFFWQNTAEGNYNIYVWADTNNVIDELNEANNILNKTMIILLDEKFDSTASSRANKYLDSTDGTRYVAQSFIPDYANLIKVSLYLSAIYNTPKNLVVEIRTNAIASGKNVPSNTILASSTIPFSKISSQRNWITINISAVLTVGQKYWIVVKDNSSSVGEYAVWWEKNYIGSTYAKGEMANSLNGASWQTYNTHDRFFKSYAIN